MQQASQWRKKAKTGWNSQKKKKEKKEKICFTPLYAFSSHGILVPAHFHESLVSGKPQGYIWFHIHEYSNDFLALHFECEFDSFSCENAVILSNVL